MTSLRILLVKTSSMGDVLHNLPVVSDLRARFPDAEIDWLVEEVFAEIPRLHSEVREVLTVALRRWRKRLFRGETWREARAFWRNLRAREYDVILDTQGLLKSAVLACAARGARAGFSALSAREPIASRFYQIARDVPRDAHAITRNRQLAAAVFGYEISFAPDYGVRLPRQENSQSVVFLTSSSKDSKLWPDTSWINLGRSLALCGLTALLPSGSSLERRRATRIAEKIPGAQAIPAMNLADLAALMAHARFVVGVDTGLTHLAAAVGTPTLALYTATSPALTGVFGACWHRNLGGKGRIPNVRDALRALAEFLPAEAEAFSGI
ncbi:MAG: lipopolysaccharide heptosyltransferase I [Zoogloeaceae bacterium]|jgi:heptosyltransferase-1|nr:lipopolysaccharide heptosyltransferase I [Zoogloeaceae bacterium]